MSKIKRMIYEPTSLCKNLQNIARNKTVKFVLCKCWLTAGSFMFIFLKMPLTSIMKMSWYFTHPHIIQDVPVCLSLVRKKCRSLRKTFQDFSPYSGLQWWPTGWRSISQFQFSFKGLYTIPSNERGSYLAKCSSSTSSVMHIFTHCEKSHMVSYSSVY